MAEKIQAMSMEAKASAAIIGSLPPVVMALVWITTPDYISLLWTTPLGQFMLVGCALWMTCGVLVMTKMINFDFGRCSMIDFLITRMHDARFMTMLLAAIAASVTAYTLVMPLFAGEGLAKRMKAVASERERIRQRERDRLAKTEKVSLRQTPKQLVSKVVEDFNLSKWLAQEAARDQLVMAGYRGQAPYVTFLFARAVPPIVLFLGAVLYVFVITHMEKSMSVKLGICVV